jgi:predicted DNA binding CopG/RHH family protein
MKKKSPVLKKLPVLRSDKAAEDFVAKADLTEYDLSEMKTVRFEFQPKSERVNMRLPGELLRAVRASAAKAGMPYQRFIRQTLEAAVHSRKSLATLHKR